MPDGDDFGSRLSPQPREHLGHIRVQVGTFIFGSHFNLFSSYPKEKNTVPYNNESKRKKQMRTAAQHREDEDDIEDEDKGEDELSTYVNISFHT